MSTSILYFLSDHLICRNTNYEIWKNKTLHDNPFSIVENLEMNITAMEMKFPYIYVQITNNVDTCNRKKLHVRVY